MILGGIVTMPTRVPTPTLKALHFDISCIVLAAKDHLPISDLVVVVFGGICTRLGVWLICRLGVTFAKAIWVVRIDIRRGRIG